MCLWAEIGGAVEHNRPEYRQHHNREHQHHDPVDHHAFLPGAFDSFCAEHSSSARGPIAGTAAVTGGACMFDLTVTFDNGPEPAVTPMVLDVLARRSVRTTFFVIGNKLMNRDARACAERAHAEGHWIGNHTFTHSRPLGEQPGAAAELEIARTQAEIGALSHPDRLFRPTGGAGPPDARVLSPEAAALLTAGGYTC